MVNDGCALTLKEKDLKPEDMTKAQFIEKEEIAKVDILLALDDKVLFNVQIVNTTVKTLWDGLCGVYEDKSLASKFFLRRQLYNLKMNDETFVHEHSKVFNSLVNDLLVIDAKVDEEEQTTLLSCSLPNSCDNLIKFESFFQT